MSEATLLATVRPTEPAGQAVPTEPAVLTGGLRTPQLAARTAEAARAIAEVVERAGSEHSGSALAVDFLRDWAASVEQDAAASTAPHHPVAPDHRAPEPLDLLIEHFGLTELETRLLVLAGLPDEHEGLASTFRSLHPQGEPRGCAGLAALVVESSGGDRHQLRAVLSAGSAVRHGLISLAGPSLFESSLLLAPALWECLHGHDGWPDELERVALTSNPVGYHDWLAEPDSVRAARALTSREPRTLLINAPDEVIALGRCAALGNAAGVPLLAARCAAGSSTAVQLLAAHAAVRGAVAVLLPHPSADTAPSAAPVLAGASLPGPLLVCAPAGTIRLPAHRAVHQVPAGACGPADLQAAWRQALPELAGQVADLAARHPIDPALTAQIGLDARSRDRLDAPPAGAGACAEPGDRLAEISRLIRHRAGVSLPPGMQLVHPAVPWQRLVLGEDSAAQLRDSVVRVEQQAVVLDDWGLLAGARATRGVRLLFTGPPGTGKSLAAEVVATALATDLLLIDASQVVSKWIGETEKNLGAAFDVAERTQAVLFLDEADALFGSRTEISDAHDRYANLETAYLLQRLDRFDGLALLATNLRQNIDTAFLRRMDFVVDFPLPDLAGRRELWRLHLPTDRLGDDVGLDALSRLYPVPGGWIRNAAIAASFLAAAAGDHVRQRHLVLAMRREYAKAALPFPGEPPRRPDDM